MTTDHPRRWLVLRLEAPLLSFGGVAIDNHGLTWDFPALSMLTGLFANALGYDRTEREAHQALQDRLIVASRRDDEPYLGTMQDVQNVNMEKSDKGWTTRGKPEGRDGESYGGPHRRFRDYHPDAVVSVVVSLGPPPNTALTGGRHYPSLDELAHALDRPERPLFIGRKPCLPAWPINAGVIEAETAHAALMRLPLPRTGLPGRAYPSADSRNRAAERHLRGQWPVEEGPSDAPLVDRLLSVPDRRNWISGLHGGTRRVVEGRVPSAVSSVEATR
jgi:CRISPR system Cascade subunit CasD